MKKGKLSRRSFFKTIGTASIAFPFISHQLISAPPSSRVRFAAFGTANMARVDIYEIISHPNVDFIAAADVDNNFLSQIKKDHPQLKIYTDYRKLLDEEKDIDCLSISTPDHTHAVMAMAAMQRNLAIYCQKPMAHDIYEVRKLTEYAQQNNIITQMGIQIHAHDIYRSTPKIIQSGIIGKIKETWSWCGNSYGSEDPLPSNTSPTPNHLNWDLWLNTAAERPYIEGQYHPGVWRNILDLGTGVLGDMGCHIFDNIFSSLELKAPISVRSEGPEPNKWYWAKNEIVHYTFPGNSYTAEDKLPVHWHSGGNLPPEEIRKLVGELPHSGSIFLGTEGIYLIPHFSTPKLFKKNGDKYEEYPEIQKLITLPTISHWHQFIDGVLAKGTPAANFDYAGPLAECILIGTIASRFRNTTLKWDCKNMQFDLKEANCFIKRTYRKGWEIEGL